MSVLKRKRIRHTFVHTIIVGGLGQVLWFQLADSYNAYTVSRVNNAHLPGFRMQRTGNTWQLLGDIPDREQLEAPLKQYFHEAL